MSLPEAAHRMDAEGELRRHWLDAHPRLAIGPAGLAHASMRIDLAPAASTERPLRVGRREIALLRDAPRGDIQPLPQPGSVAEPGLWATLSSRRSVRDYSNEPLGSHCLSELLFHSVGVTGTQTAYGLRGLPLRRVPSAGGIQSTDVYLLARRADTLRGIYRYSPIRHALEAIDEKADPDWQIGTWCPYARWAAGAAIVFVVVAMFRRVEWKYGAASYRLLHLDAGAVLQNLYLASTGLGLGSCAIAGYDEGRVHQALQLHEGEEFVSALVAVGQPVHSSQAIDH